MRPRRKASLALAAVALAALAVVSVAPIGDVLWLALPGLLALAAGLTMPAPRHAQDRRWAAAALLLGGALATCLWWGLAAADVVNFVSGLLAALMVLSACGTVAAAWTVPQALAGSWRDGALALLAMAVAVLAFGAPYLLLAAVVAVF